MTMERRGPESSPGSKSYFGKGVQSWDLTQTWSNSQIFPIKTIALWKWSCDKYI